MEFASRSDESERQIEYLQLEISKLQQEINHLKNSHGQEMQKRDAVESRRNAEVSVDFMLFPARF